MLLNRATIRITDEQLLSSIWYADGSGAHWGGVGLSDDHRGWRITHVRLMAPPLGVEIDIELEEPTVVIG